MIEEINAVREWNVHIMGGKSISCGLICPLKFEIYQPKHVKSQEDQCWRHDLPLIVAKMHP